MYFSSREESKLIVSREESELKVIGRSTDLPVFYKQYCCIIV